ncbi:MAG: hypothetical protein KBT27_05040 [Prevotellaceae bacterium]|nr:hypothetical protein [Candidatus Faecinaster equi]
MKRSVIFETILGDIAIRLVNAGHRNADWKNDFDTTLLTGIQNGVGFIKNVETSIGPNFDSYFSSFLHFIDGQLNDQERLDEEITVPSPVLREATDAGDIAKIKPLVSAADPIVFTTKSLFSQGTVIDFRTDAGNLVWKGIERLWTGIAAGSAEAQRFWSFCQNCSDSHYYIQTSIEGGSPSPETSWKIYSFAYLRNVNESRFEIPEKLRFSFNPLTPYLVFDISAKYEQFFDICDVLNEVKFSNDALMKFLKVYQVLEQLAYRKKFIKLIDEHVQNHYPIVRSIESVTNSFKQNELAVFEGIFTDEMRELYNAIDVPDANGNYSAVEPACMNQATRDKINSLYGITASGTKPYYSPKQLGDIVYKIRCSIVHNKETELHFTSNNISDYEELIELIKKLSEVLCLMVFKLINDGVNLPLTYNQRELTLY